MATTASEIKTRYPLPVYNFRVDIGTETIGFAEVSGLSIGYETTTYRESPTGGGQAGPHVMIMPGQATSTTVTLRRGMVLASSLTYLYDWIGTVRTNQVDKRDVTVRLCDEADATVMGWRVTNAFPTRLDAPTFDAASSEVAVETLVLVADGVTVLST